MADELRLAIILLSEVERAQLVTRVIDGADMVFGVRPDDDQSNGFGGR